MVRREDENRNVDGHRYVSVREFHALLIENGIEVSLYVIYKWLRDGTIPREKTEIKRKLKKNGYYISTSAIEDILRKAGEFGNIEKAER